MADAKWVYGSVIGYFIAALFNSILVVIKETYESVHDWLAATFGHHWVGQGILVIIVFLVFTFIGSAMTKGGDIDEAKANQLITITVLGTILSVLIIAGFFLLHFSS